MPDMPKFEKPPASLVERFDAVVDRIAPEAGRRPMFGHPCAWIGGNMATGLFADMPPKEPKARKPGPGRARAS